MKQGQTEECVCVVADNVCVVDSKKSVCVVDNKKSVCVYVADNKRNCLVLKKPLKLSEFKSCVVSVTQPLQFFTEQKVRSLGLESPQPGFRPQLYCLSDLSQVFQPP